jgi:MoaA/NifB/PqqE/SkfB family radical SAM enzyme
MIEIPHKHFCILPWVSLEASPVGTVRPCCLAEDEIVDSELIKFNLATADLKEIQDSVYMSQLRKAFLAGKRPSTCRKCWQEEDAGRTSKRMHTLDRLKHMVVDQNWTTDAKPLVFLDLKLGNICNLKCRICGSWSSSQFAAEEIKHAGNSDFHRMMLKQGAWPRENRTFWDQIDGMLDQIRYIEFTGGEPFMIQEHFDMLQGIVDRGIAHQVEIHYNTNGTHYPEHGEQIWRHFKTVEIAFSIDDIGSRFEYQRTNARWQEVCENLDRFRDLRNIHANIVLQICCTVNVFNVRYLDQVARWIADNRHSFNFVYWNLMHEAWYFSISRLPQRVKAEIRQHLLTAQIPDIYAKDINGIIDFMMMGEESDGLVMLSKIAELDRRRKQDLGQTAPELAEILGYDKT